MDIKEVLKKEMNLNEKLPPKEKYKLVEEYQEKIINIFAELKTEVYPNEPGKVAKDVRNHYLKHPVDCKPFDFLLLCYGTDLFFNNFPIENCTNPAYSWGLDVVIEEQFIRFSFSLREDARLLYLEDLEAMFDANPIIADYIKVNNYSHDAVFVNSYSKKVKFNDVSEVIPIIDGEFKRFAGLYNK